MSELVPYDPSLVEADVWNPGTAEWDTVTFASLTVNKSYDVDEETGVQLLSVDTATVTLSYKDWDLTHGDEFTLGLEFRVAYLLPVKVFIFAGVVSSIAKDVQSNPREMTVTVNALGYVGSILGAVITWESLPAELPTTRIRRWLTTLHENSLDAEAQPLMPAEEKGEATLLDLLRAFCVFTGRAVWMPSSSWAEVVDDSTDLVEPFITADGDQMYSSVTYSNSAGDRVLDFDDDVAAGSATFLGDDMRLINTTWRLPYALPCPLVPGLVARTGRLAMTFTPTHCGGSVDFYFPSSGGARKRPPAGRFKVGSPGGYRYSSDFREAVPGTRIHVVGAPPDGPLVRTGDLWVKP